VGISHVIVKVYYVTETFNITVAVIVNYTEWAKGCTLQYILRVMEATH
jgi:hypothetical protein